MITESKRTKGTRSRTKLCISREWTRCAENRGDIFDRRITEGEMPYLRTLMGGHWTGNNRHILRKINSTLEITKLNHPITLSHLESYRVLISVREEEPRDAIWKLSVRSFPNLWSTVVSPWCISQGRSTSLDQPQLDLCPHLRILHPIRRELEPRKGFR